jgi:hypothetical protein
MRYSIVLLVSLAIPLCAQKWQPTPLPGQPINVGGFAGGGGVNGGVYVDSSGGLHATATGGAGTLCWTSTNGGVPIWGACSGSPATAFAAITAGTNTTALVMGTGGSIEPSGTGTIDANKVGGVLLSGLATGLVKLTAGVPSIAAAGTDYISPADVGTVTNTMLAGSIAFTKLSTCLGGVIQGSPMNCILTPQFGIQNSSAGSLTLDGSAGAGGSLILNGTGGSPGTSTISVNAAGTTLNLGSANATVTTAGAVAFASETVSGAVTFSGVATGTQVSCLGLNSSNAVVLATGACGSGGGGSVVWQNSAVTAVTSGTFNAVPGFGMNTPITNVGGVATFTPAVNTAVIPSHVQIHANDNFCTLTSSGVTALTCSSANQVITTLTNGQVYYFFTDTANVTTITADSLTTNALKWIDGTTALPAGMIAANSYFSAIYDGMNAVWRYRDDDSPFVLTTTGSGAPTFVGGVLNIPTGGGSGTVTTTGSPASPNMAKFSGSTSITNAVSQTDFGAAPAVGVVTFPSNVATWPAATNGAVTVYTLAPTANATSASPATNPTGLTTGETFQTVYTQGSSQWTMVWPSNFIGAPVVGQLATGKILTCDWYWTGTQANVIACSTNDIPFSSTIADSAVNPVSGTMQIWPSSASGRVMSRNSSGGIFGGVQDIAAAGGQCVASIVNGVPTQAACSGSLTSSGTPANTYITSWTSATNITGTANATISGGAQTLGTDNTTAGTLQLSNGSASFHTILGSVATANNTVNFFATAPVTGDLVSCVTASTTCTLTDAGVLAANVVTSASTNASGMLLLGNGARGVTTNTLVFSGGVLSANSSSQAVIYQGAQTQGSNNVAFATSGFQGADMTGAGGASSATGQVYLRGGDNSATNVASKAGSLLIRPGHSIGATSTGLQGVIVIGASYAPGATVTQWNLQCGTSTSMQSADCGASPTNIIGVAYNVLSTAVDVAFSGQTLVNASAAVTLGHTVCAGTTAGQVTDSGGTGACSTGVLVGTVIATSGTFRSLTDATTATAIVPTATLPLIALTPSLGSSSGSGTVTTFSAGALSPLFTTSVATATTTPALTFTLTNAGAGTVFGNNTGSSGAPAYTAAPVLGLNGTTNGTLGLATSTTSGATITLQNLGTLTAYNFNLPTTPGSAGQVLTSQGGGSTAMTWGNSGGGGIVVYSGPSLTVSGTAYFPISGGGSSSATETNVDVEAPSAATVTNFYVQLSAALTTGNAVVTWRKNAASTSVTCTISGASTSCNDTTHSFSVAQGDLVDIQVVASGSSVGLTIVMATQFGTTGSNGTVNSATIGQLGWYAGTGTAVSGNANFALNSGGTLLANWNGITTAGLGTPTIGWVSNATAQSASQSTVTIATAPTSGHQYRLHYYANLNTPCTTGSNSVTFQANWTDAGNARQVTIGTLMMPAAQSLANFLTGNIDIWIGSGNVTYASTVNGTCATGTSSYDVHWTMEEAQ